jgi:hypothetical protein
MRAAPAVRITAVPSPVSRRLVALLASSAAAMLSWWAGGWLDWSARVAAGVMAAAALLAWLGIGAALSRRPVTLDWNGRQWTWLSPPPAVAEAGEIGVAMDLGPWLLLRFRRTDGPRRSRWIALQRAGLETHWHALRCALYSPRPAAETGAAAAEPAPDTHDRP